MKSVRIGVTCGDVADRDGVLLKASRSSPSGQMHAVCPPEHVLEHGNSTGAAQERLEPYTEIDCPPSPLDTQRREQPILEVNPDWSDVSWESLERGAKESQEGTVDAILTLPITKRIVQRPSEQFPGQTEFFAVRWAADSYAMMLAAPHMRVVPVTTHIPLSEVPAALSRERIQACIALTEAALVERFGIAHPTMRLWTNSRRRGRLDGKFEIIEPARKFQPAAAIGLAADTLFPKQQEMGVDAIIAISRPGSHPPQNPLLYTGVNTTIGLPGIRTSPDHGVAYNLAGRNAASASSTLCALQMAIEHARYRALESI